MVPFIDIHTHQTALRSDIVAVRNIFLQDYNALITFPFSAGIHPWHADHYSGEEILQMLEAAVRNPHLVGLGETGLDKKCKVDLQLQQVSFNLHLLIAEKTDKPLIIHCVGAWDELIAATAKTSAKMILHGYNGGIELSKQLIQKGFLFSIGKSILDERSKIGQAINHIPLSSLFCETDEYNADISVIYEKTAMLRGIPVDQLKQELNDNYRRIFHG